MNTTPFCLPVEHLVAQGDGPRRRRSASDDDFGLVAALVQVPVEECDVIGLGSCGCL
ncbi:hypothetical protein [Streptomyces phaeochromogenes]|uniref:hypothetical protein n=1 Tax=Streptomyces phaeochromogenes TaxID=1923 RepID=UPI002DDC2A32|nr:hypothetical protein [Streptomyces phaeochromogenes]WRZ34640.1 hypothetical protein OG931_46350 [Streptomyces phaeochromogenes]